MSMSKDKTSSDEVILQVREIKEQLSAAFDFDIDRILADARVRQTQSDRIVIPAPARGGLDSKRHQVIPVDG